MLHHILFALLAFFAGYMSAIAGSSGLIVLPALLFSGIPPHTALGTNKLYTTVSLLTSSVVVIKRRAIDPVFWITASFFCLIGGVFGVILVHLIHPLILSKILPFFIAFISIYTIIPHKKLIFNKQNHNVTPVKQAITASIISIYSGFIGSGTGAIWTNTAMRFFHIDILQASALSRFFCFLSNISALFAFILAGSIDYSIGILIAISGCFGAFLGTKKLLSISQKAIRLSIFTLTSLLSIYLGYKAFFMPCS